MTAAVATTTSGGRLYRPSTAKLLRAALDCLACGSLAVELPNGDKLQGCGPIPGPAASWLIRRWDAFQKILAAGSIGFAEGYMHGSWDTPDLVALIELAARNPALLGLADRAPPWSRMLTRAWHFAHRNTRAGSRRNIRAHYDLGNDFYALWLDGGMSYSSALFESDAQSLEVAQEAKLDRVLEMLDLQPGMRTLEVGIGWGALAEQIARRGAVLTGLTLSPAQLAYSRARLDRCGLAHQAQLWLRDYREGGGRYDRIVSIEMLEAVGKRWWPRFFNLLKRRLASSGVAVIQCITIADDLFDNYQHGVDFIQRYIFPGGMLPCESVLRQQIRRARLQVQHHEGFGSSYALTLAEWRRRFEAARPALEELGFDVTFRRMWTYYLAYCEAGFRSGKLDVGLWRIGHAE